MPTISITRAMMKKLLNSKKVEISEELYGPKIQTFIKLADDLIPSQIQNLAIERMQKDWKKNRGYVLVALEEKE